MADAGDQHVARAGNRVGHEAVDLHARLVVLADDQERRHRQLAQPRRQRVDAGSLGQDLPARVRKAARPVGHETGADEPLGRRPLRDVPGEQRIRQRRVGEGLEAVALQRIGEGVDRRGPVGRLVGARAGVGDDQRGHHLRMGEREVERDVPAHREAAHRGTADLQMLEQRAEVGDGDRLGVGGRVVRSLGDPVTAHVIGHDAPRARQRLHLRIPHAEPAGEAVREHERRPVAGDLVVERHAVHIDARHRRGRTSGPTRALSRPGCATRRCPGSPPRPRHRPSCSPSRHRCPSTARRPGTASGTGSCG